MRMISPLERPPAAEIRPPGSKSLTNRTLVLAALASRDGPTTLSGVSECEDTWTMSLALALLGFQLETSWQEERITVERNRSDAVVPAGEAALDVRGSGTAMRFLTALAALGRGPYRLDGTGRMRERPIEDLLEALRQLGADARSELGNGCPPVIVASGGLLGGRVRMPCATSSQFASALLMVAPFARSDVELELVGPIVSRPYLAMTARLVAAFGGRIEVQPDLRRLLVGAGQPYTSQEIAIEPDASAAAVFFGAAAITGGRISVPGLGRRGLQGDTTFVDLLQEMGCHVSEEAGGLTVQGASLRGIEADLGDLSDCTMCLAAVACFAEGPTTIRNVAHVRHKESDRISAIARELRRAGARVDELEDGLRITPAPLHGTVVHTYEDHRIAMALTLLGLKVPGIAIANPGCVAKSYPAFFEDVDRLYQ